MVEVLKRSLRHSAAARWITMAVVSFTMLCGYFVADVAAPLQTLIESELHWNSEQYGLFTSAYGWFNVFAFMLIIGGVILDKKGPRFAGMLASILMVAGCTLKWWAFNTPSLGEWTILGQNAQVMLAAIGYAVFGMGIELCGITATKIIARWFKGYEIALAMGLQVAIARIGTGIALGASAPIAQAFGHVSAPVLGGAILLAVGLVAFVFYIGMDKKLDASEPADDSSKSEESFRLGDIGQILTNRGFWYIAILCALFYSGVFPFLKYATGLMVRKFGVSEEFAGLIPMMLPFGTMLLTPIFGRVYDKKGKGATIMIIGSLLIMAVHVIFALPFVTHWVVAVVAMLLLGIGFSLVPSAMWPSVPKMLPYRQLGTAYALIFYLQNLVALMFIPWLVGMVLNRFGTTKVIEQQLIEGVKTSVEVVHYDYTLPMMVFITCGVLAVLVALMLKGADKKHGYGLELPNQEQ
jgi:MFS family permease